MITQSVIIQGKLVSFFSGYFKEFRDNISGFERFEQDALLYALLEYSKYPRPYTPTQRIKYLYEKCCEYTGEFAGNISVEEEERYGYFTVFISPSTDDSFPF